MDDKGGRRQQVESHARRRNGVKSDKQDYMRRSFKSVSKFLKTHYRSLFTCLLLTVLVALLFAVFGQFQAPATNQAPNGANVIDYSTFVDQVNAGNVEAVTIQGNEINALLAQPITQGVVSVTSSQATTSKSSFAADFTAWSRYVGAGYSWPTTTTTPPLDPQRAVYTRLPGSSDVRLLPLLRSHHVVVNFLAPAQSPIWLALLWKFVPILLLALVFLLIFAPRNSSRSNRAIDDRVTQVGKSRVRRFERAKESGNPRSGTEKTASTNAMKQSNSAHVILDSPVTFEDVAGIDEVRTELEEIVQFLRSPERFSRLGARIPRGALLVGPPGTGKTLLAKAVAGEAGVPFFSMSASEFVEMFVGVGASRVRDLFNQARQSAPCVVFIDEIDAVGRKRSVRVMGNDERDQTLNQLLVELDGFDARQAVVVLAATNRVDILDKALLRPGRFDRHINVSLPDRVGREAILKVHTRKTPLHEDVSLERLARMTTGMSGADLANLVNEAALGAARRDLDSLTHECFEDALARVQLGALRPLAITETDRRIIAFHEGGHALVAYHLPQADNVNCVTILPRGQSLGVTQFIAEEDRYNYSRETLMARIAVGLGGRVAEELTFGPERVTTGAENDLQVVTDLARRMVTRWGMSEQVGVIFADYSSETGGAGLNMSRVEIDARPIGGRSLIMHEHGRLRLNSGNGENGDLPVRQHAMAMNTPFAMAPTRGGTASSATMAAMIDAEVQRILNEGRAMARALLSEHHDQLTKLADALMEQEHLNRKQFEELLAE
jgi:ATP-dependent metalloprotease FtsH